MYKDKRLWAGPRIKVLKNAPKGNKISVLFLIIVVLFLTGCSIPGTASSEKGTAPDVQSKDSGKEKQQQTTGILVASPLTGQQNGTVLSAEEYNQNVLGVKETLNLLIDSLIVNDITKAQGCMIGLDEGGGQISIEELQQEFEKLHPVKWQVREFRPAEGEKALVTLEFTMSDGSVRGIDPFSIVNLGDKWVVHFNSFSTSFHEVARHLIKDFKKQG